MVNTLYIGWLCIAVLLLLCFVHRCGGVEATAATLFPDIRLD